MSREGSLEAPTRHIIDWRDPDFTDVEKLDAEMRRVFDICHGCRRCFNLCDSFPRLFDLIDATPEGEVEGVKSEDFPKIVEACTLCDMCFMTKCPYVPPHPFNLDFPHLMLRYRAAEAKAGKTNFVARQLAEMDRNGRLAQPISALVNFAEKNSLARGVMSIGARYRPPRHTARIPHAHFHAGRPHLSDPRQRSGAGPRGEAARPRSSPPASSTTTSPKPAWPRAPCSITSASRRKSLIPAAAACRFLEQAELDRVAENAAKVSKELVKLIDEGYDIVTLTASCGLMFKFEWPLIVPDNADVKKLAASTFDIDEYVVMIAKKHGLPDGLASLPEGVTVHLACHARAQNMGPKAAEMLRLLPETPVDVIERCAGHGGTFGVLKETHGIAMKVGKPVMRTAVNQARGHIASDCPLAAKHIVQGAERIGRTGGNGIAGEEGRASDRNLRPRLRAQGDPLMTAQERKITPADIIPYKDYAAKRTELRRNLIATKKNRRVEVGPFATFYFENYDTMWLQVQEMLHIEKGGEDQIAGELEAYNPLIPQGNELIATLMLEIEDAVQREKTLKQLAGIEESVSFEIAGTRVKGTPTEYDDRTTPDGKTSSVHWVRFVFTPELRKQFADPGARVLLAIEHPNYGHIAVISPEIRAELAKDFA